MPWQQLLSPQTRLPVVGLEAWYASLLERIGNPAPLQLALLGGRLAATPGLAFLAGYQGALRALWPAAPWTLGALCVTENRSTRPADMSTRINALTLDGRKDFVTAAEAADWLLVAAREEDAGAPVQLALGVVRNGAPGVQIETLPALPLMPDVSHGRLHLQGAQCERLAGDGWDDYVKPFRTLEDTHVLAALTAWLFGVGQESAWPQALQLRLLGLLAGCAEVARQCPSAAGSHVMLAGLFAQFDSLRSDLDNAFAAGDAHWAQLWQRDQGVLAIAGSARSKRLQKAQTALGMTF
ncbi:MAG: acyl-CoA dehydrogenase [Pseudomonas sp.]|uniref:acyl-CoA dehydrogenase family protein n=1 Tax=Pseudomonas sp. TaxID=306 RepID=UPI0027280CC0|nr:acyl-CoA dehydrogenase family protein [Pseudomonas sp.]MDO9616246.1 acyl-CoA dehydrogenase [Pseudomonas sp.]MDP2447819.1 acyl-CoA dehydrogenase [Pseudomonas sp.]MDZ4335321.1 acyl-CoA dehydrogenase [Pseudomonas sp.]